MRPVFGALHRWLGLATAAFLAVAGLTGSVIAFVHELDEALNPELFTASAGDAFLSPTALAQSAEAHDPRARAVFMGLEREQGRAAVLIVQPRDDPATGKPYELGYNQVFADPITGRVIGRRDWGAIALDRAHLIPLIYTLHINLLLPGKSGTFLMGGIAILWTIDCFIGLALTFPRGRPFLAKWKPAWLIRRRADPHRRNVDIHRAGGLWFWALLLIMAVSGVSLALNEQVFRPVVSLFSTLTPSVREIGMARLSATRPEPRLSFETAIAHVRKEARRRGLTQGPAAIFYAPRFGAYGVSIGEEHGTGLGASWLYVDDQTGELLLADMRGIGIGSAGDIFLQLQFPLHSGQIAGIAGRAAVAALGLAVATLAVTGVIIWSRKRYARVVATQRRQTKSNDCEASVERPRPPPHPSPLPGGERESDAPRSDSLSPRGRGLG